MADLELVDIINVVSVTQQATVNQVTDENDDQIQQALYWRQALDVRTFELSVSIQPPLRFVLPKLTRSFRLWTEYADARNLEIQTKS